MSGGDEDDLIRHALGLAGNRPYIPEPVDRIRSPVQEAIIQILDMVPKIHTDVITMCTNLFHELEDTEKEEYYGWWKLKYIVSHIPTTNDILLMYINVLVENGCNDHPPPPPKPLSLYTRSYYSNQSNW